MTRYLAPLFATALAVLCLVVPAPAGAAGDGAQPHRPRIGLVLSGGGARGAAHIGVLKVLEEMRIPVDVVVGTSMGSLVGGCYAAGVAPDELERRVTTVDWNILFTDNPPRRDWPARRKQASMTPTFDFTVGVRDGKLKLPPGAIAGQKVQLFFSDLTKGVETIHDFDDFPIPFRAVATDLEDGRMKVFERGPLPVAMRSSMSVPTIFAPMQWEDHLYVDGGLVRNLPIDVARAMGVDIIIAVNLGSGYLPRDQLGNIVGVTGQMIAILTQQNVDASLKQIRSQDVLILPDLGDIGSGDFNRAAEAIVIGVKAAHQAAPALARFSVSEAEYAEWQAARFGPGRPVREVGEVRVAGLEVVNPGVFHHLIAEQADRPLDRRQLVANIQQVYGSGDFERISYHFEPRRDGSDLLIVNALEKAWGPGYLSLGLGLTSDSRGTGLFGVRGSYDRTWVNRLGATWSTDITLGNTPAIYTEFFQPLSLSRALFVAPYLDLGTTPESVFLDEQRVARYDVARGRAGVDLGTTIRGTEARVGLYYGQTRVSLDTGVPQMPTGNVTDSGLRARLVYDTLDSAAAPRSGSRLMLDLTNPLKSLGAQVQYSRTELTAETAFSSGANTLGVRLRGGSSFGADMPYYDQFMLGGFLNLSGYAYDQFRGNDMAFAALVYYRQIAVLTPPLGRGLYLGASLEAGWLSDGVFSGILGRPYQVSAEDTRYGGSVFFGSDTWIGPFYLAAGLSSSGEATYYVILGRP